MENQTIEQMQSKFRAAFNGMNALMDPDSIKACANEFTQEEMNQFHGMKFAMNKETLNTHEWKLDALKDKLEALEAETEQAKALAALAIFGTISALTLIGTVAVLHLQEIEEETRKITKKKITLDTTAYRIGKQEKEAFITEMKLKGYTTKRWMRKYINECTGEKLF